MGYCSVDDIKSVKAIKRLLPPDGSWSDGDILSKIEDITVLINSRLSDIASVPLSPVPEILSRICRLKTAFEMLNEEFGEADGKYAYLNEEAEYLLSRIERREIMLNPDEAGKGRTKIIAPERRYFSMGD